MQFYSSNDIPFYVNLPEVVLARCLDDPKTAPIIKRYPVLKKDDQPIWYELFSSRSA